MVSGAFARVNRVSAASARRTPPPSMTQIRRLIMLEVSELARTNDGSNEKGGTGYCQY